jgi:hypothetical protein
VLTEENFSLKRHRTNRIENRENKFKLTFPNNSVISAAAAAAATTTALLLFLG